MVAVAVPSGAASPVTSAITKAWAVWLSLSSSGRTQTVMSLVKLYSCGAHAGY